MAQLTLSQRTQIANDPSFQAKVRSWLKNRANFWKDAATAARADVNRRMQKRKKFGRSILVNPGYIDTFLTPFSEFFIMQYAADPPVLDGSILADSEFDSAAFNAAYDYFAGVASGDDTDTEIDW